MGLAGVDLNLLVALDALLAERNVTRVAGPAPRPRPGPLRARIAEIAAELDQASRSA